MKTKQATLLAIGITIGAFALAFMYSIYFQDSVDKFLTQYIK